MELTQKSKISTLREVMKRLKFPQKENQMYSSDWFLTKSLLTFENDFKKCTDHMRELRDLKRKYSETPNGASTYDQGSK